MTFTTGAVDFAHHTRTSGKGNTPLDPSLKSPKMHVRTYVMLAFFRFFAAAPSPSLELSTPSNTMSMSVPAGNSAALKANPQPSLSRNALYTPLIAYEQEKNDPSTFMASRKSIPNSLKESSLIDMLQTVSSRQEEKPLSSQAIDERIRQRALTLVGGGITSSMTGKARNNKKRKQEELPNRQRKRIQQQAIRTEQDGETHEMKQKKSNEDMFTVLVELNQKWNAYVRKLAGVDGSFEFSASSRNKLLKRLEQLELVGAHVKLIVCSSHKEWVGKEGLIVGATRNTWTLALVNLASAAKQKQQPKVLVVPKRGSQVMFRIPVQEGSPCLCVTVHGDCTSTALKERPP